MSETGPGEAQGVVGQAWRTLDEDGLGAAVVADAQPAGIVVVPFSAACSPNTRMRKPCGLPVATIDAHSVARAPSVRSRPTVALS